MIGQKRPRKRSNEAIFEQAAKKLPPLSLKVLASLLPCVDHYLQTIERQFSFTDQGVILIKKEGIPDWSGYYTEASPAKRMFEIWLSLVRVKGLSLVSPCQMETNFV